MYNNPTMSKDKLIIPGGGEVFRDTDPTPRQRLPYGAVPLDPWGASFYHEQQTYFDSSIQRIQRKLITTMVDQDWFRDGQKAYLLHELMRASLIHSHYTRIDKNARIDLGVVSESDDSRLDDARAGIASPDELFTILADYPQLGSLELAKLSHPFDFEESREMDDTMVDLMLLSGGKLLDDDPTYRVKRIDPNLPAAIVLRKQNLMDFYLNDYDKVRIVQRQGFLVFEGEGLDDDFNLELFLKRSSYASIRDTAIGARVESHLREHPKGQPHGWVQPQASSYYAKYIPVAPVTM